MVKVRCRKGNLSGPGAFFFKVTSVSMKEPQVKAVESDHCAVAEVLFTYAEWCIDFQMLSAKFPIVVEVRTKCCTAFDNMRLRSLRVFSIGLDRGKVADLYSSTSLHVVTPCKISSEHGERGQHTASYKRPPITASEKLLAPCDNTHITYYMGPMEITTPAEHGQYMHPRRPTGAPGPFRALGIALGAI